MKHKLSNYIVFAETSEVDQKDLVTKKIAFSTRSTQTLVLPSAIAESLQLNQFQELSEDTFLQLKELKFIVPESEDELRSIVDENKQAIQNDKMLYYVIQPTASCQLGCDYCGQEHKKTNMSPEIYDKIIQRISSKLTTQHSHLRIGWFGAEPLVGLRQIRELTPMLLKLAKDNNLEYSAKIVTNGLSLKENIFEELITQLHIKGIEVTLDGIAEFHDQRRHTKEKDPTFGIIFKNLKAIIDRPDYFDLGCRLSIRCNVDKRNFNGVSPLIKLLAENGFAEKISYFYPIGVYSWGNDAHQKSLTKEEFAEKEIDWLMEMLEYGFNVSLLPGRVKTVCLAVSPLSEMIDTYGNIFNCTEVSYVPAYENSNYVIGNLKFPIETYSTTRPLTDWNDRVLNKEFPCTACKMLPVCGGACPKSWHEDMRACPPNKFNIQDKLVLSYLSTKENFKELLHEVNQCS
jgi:uncharacterized protein